MNFRAPISLETFCSSVALLIEGKAAYLSDLGVLGEVPAVVVVPRLGHIIGHLLALVEAHAVG